MPRIDAVIPVHNGERAIGKLLQRLLSLPVPPDWTVALTVVDDGSTDTTPGVLAGFHSEHLQVVTLAERGGRANACNRGASGAEGDYLLFLDADCLPIEDDYFRHLVRQLSTGAELVYGPITSRGEGFWPRYLLQVAAKRAGAAATEDHILAMTSANLAVRRSLFEQVGGFSSDYRHYGFEDKDLIARLLAERPTVRFEPGCAVLHDAGNTVANYCAKMREAARWTAPIFAARHPDTYRRMAFARLDPAFAGPTRRVLLLTAGRFMIAPVVWLAGVVVERAGIPWGVQAWLLRAAAGLSYLRGCRERPSH